MAQDWSYPREVGDYYVQAITALYPTLRNGVDFSVARPAPGDFMVVTDATREQYMDIAAIDAEALALFTADPYVDYSPTGEAPTPPVADPVLTSISPTTMASLTGTVVLTATGENFTDQSDIYVGPDLCTTTFVSATSINAGVDTDSLTAGTVPVVVKTAGSPDTAAVNLTVT